MYPSEIKVEGTAAGGLEITCYGDSPGDDGDRATDVIKIGLSAEQVEEIRNA
jgi:hypothetical protein